MLKDTEYFFFEAGNSDAKKELDYGDESEDDLIDMHEIRFKMPDKFKDSQHYLHTIW